MKKVVFKGQLLPILMSFCACFASVDGAEAPAAPQNNSAVKDSDCSKDLLLAYFPEIFVKETFTKFNVPKDKWDAIIKALNDKDDDKEKTVMKVVEEKAAKMSPNPLKDPQQRQAAVKLFRETLLEIFSSVLKAHGVTDDAKIASMLDDIQQQKIKRFAMCIKKDNESAKSMTGSASGAGNQDDDDDDDDDDEDEGDDDDEDDEDDEEEDKGDSKAKQDVKDQKAAPIPAKP